MKRGSEKGGGRSAPGTAATMRGDSVPASAGRQRMGGTAMKRFFQVCGIAFPVLLLLAGLAAWNQYFRTPPVDVLPLPDTLVALESSAGRERLAESAYIADYRRLTANFVPQSRRAYCGVASSVVTLNALRNPRQPLNQATFFNDSARKIKHPLHVSLSGMSLRQLGDLLRAHGAEVSIVYASDTDIDTFRSIARKNLMTGGDFVLVNYQRAELGQVEMGHISPLAAYHAATDSFLVLDVAAYKYPSVWVSADALWSAMSAPVGDSPQTRGFIVVREGMTKPPAPFSLGPGRHACTWDTAPRRASRPNLCCCAEAG